jgi:adenosylcobyric acid synthase
VARITGSLLVAGTTSDAGKSVITAGICRWLARQGVRVAPFKAQNMSNNSMVAPDGAEIGRAQAMQAAAAEVPAEAAMNPVLLKPGGNLRSQVVLLGRAVGETSVIGYWGSGEGRARLRSAVLDAYDDLRSRFDVVICEGAGSPAEINLRRDDIVNMGLARARKLPVIVVGDIDRGGVFAALYGTLALLDAADQAHLSGFVINKFRGHRELLDPALTQIGALTGRPVLGVLPYLDGIWIDAEDAVATERPYAVRPAAGAAGTAGAAAVAGARRTAGDTLRVAVIRPPRISNFTDIDALALEPGVAVRFVATPAEIADADLVVVPGTRATVADLGWLRGQGLDIALKRRAADRKPILAICGGYQMLGTVIHDDVESAAGAVDGGVGDGVFAGLGLLPVVTRFAVDKTLGRPAGYAAAIPVSGYEIHHGAVDVRGGEPWFTSEPAGRDPAGSGRGGAGTALDGCRYGAVSGTLWHGILENDEFRRAYLIETARLAGRNFAPAPDTSFAAARQAQFDTLADAVEEHLDTAALLRLIEQGPTPGLPRLRPGL